MRNLWYLFIRIDSRGSLANNVSYIYKYEFTLTHNYDTIIASEKI